MTDFTLHSPGGSGIGHSFWQLHGSGGGLGLALLRIFILWLEIIDFMEGDTLYASLHFFLFMTGYRMCDLGKCLSSNCRNCWPRFVDSDASQGALK